MFRNILGDRRFQTTARYADLARHAMKAAVRRTEDNPADDLDTSPAFSALWWPTNFFGLRVHGSRPRCTPNRSQSESPSKPRERSASRVRPHP